ncbi:MAG: hypothetical protein AAB700_02150 [Patescibacteria group bacterium]
MPEGQPKSLNEQFVSETTSIGLPWRLMVFSGVLFALSILIYFGMSIGYESYLNTRSAGMDTQLEELSNSISQKEQQKFVGFYSQIANLKTVLGQHIFSANIFPFLEKNTLPQTFFTEANFNSISYNLELKGRAPSLQALAQQLAQFEKAPEVHSAMLESTNFNPSGTVDFSVSLNFQPEYLAKPI